MPPCSALPNARLTQRVAAPHMHGQTEGLYHLSIQCGMGMRWSCGSVATRQGLLKRQRRRLRLTLSLAACCIRCATFPSTGV
ncbi:unnamed protein product [Ceratitis capitata]|uniref:(Mediterranean fruit fly) hypothetical protein n=1 Tax=Ceratitis capitata TaxID=7213 RepID=A0A811UIN8_CERCA|nr:unnamed protein product [Ceratitis capitata]